MSYFAVLDDRFAGDVASNSGYADLCNWIDSLDERDDLDELHILRLYGWSQELPTLETQLSHAITTSEPDGAVRDTANGLLKIVKDRKASEDVLVITDGVGMEKEPQ